MSDIDQEAGASTVCVVIGRTELKRAKLDFYQLTAT